jgi:hypothetical protein
MRQATEGSRRHVYVVHVRTYLCAASERYVYVLIVSVPLPLPGFPATPFIRLPHLRIT